MFHSYPDIYDVPPSPADLFNFDTTNKAPRIDRSSKYASTSKLDIERSSGPKIDRSDRPALTASVPIFPHDIDQRYVNQARPGSENIYDCPPTRAEIDRYSHNTDFYDNYKGSSTQVRLRAFLIKQIFYQVEIL